MALGKNMAQTFLLLAAGMASSAEVGVYQKETPQNEALQNVQPGTESSESLSWFKMGDLRLINNDWGSREAGCPDNKFKIWVAADSSFGWEFDRKACGGPSRPDYPELEFGIHPFGTSKQKATTPDFSSTALLPIQIKDVNTMTITMGEYKIDLWGGVEWNLNFEMWFTDQHPVTGTHSGAYSELMAFFGHKDGYWPNCDGNGMGTYVSGGSTYKLCQKEDNWGGWRYLQTRKTNPGTSYSGTYDVKAALDWLVANHGHSGDLWISRLELGTEIGDNTSGKVTMRNIKFEVNGDEAMAEFYEEPTEAENRERLSLAPVPAGTVVTIADIRGHRTTKAYGGTFSQGQWMRTLEPGVYTLFFPEGLKRKPERLVVVR